MRAAGSGLSRREAIALLGGAALTSGLPAGGQAGVLGAAVGAVPRPGGERHRTENTIGADDVAFLDEMQRRACLFFVEQASAENGQVLDRALNRPKDAAGGRDKRKLASIAATGFGLTALCVAAERGYRPAKAIEEQVLRTLDFHLNKMPEVHGFLFHFNNVDTGKPAPHTELSSIDTSIFLCGVLTCRAYFADRKIKELATALYERVDWPWMLNNGQTFAMGWYPDKGFIASRWDHYCELMMLYLLAVGSPTHPAYPAVWKNFARPRVQFAGFDYISGFDPLFVHQFTHAWFDLGGKRDAYADYYVNSIAATKAHKAFCLSLGLGYADDFWGVTASDWEHGYTAWGGPPLIGPVDGTVVPAAAAGSLPFLPVDCLRVLRAMKEKYGDKAWGRYGFCDAFHPARNWYDPDVLGIDLGIGVLMAENLRSGFVWKTFMKNAEMGKAMELVGFKKL